MIEVIFTLDYEIYGNGEGSLKELVYEPAEKLREIFKSHKARFVLFPEVLELEAIEREKADPYIVLVTKQIKQLYEEGFEVGLHIHPWWYNAQRKKGTWTLDYSEYNLCTLPTERIIQILDKTLRYLKVLLGDGGHTPLSYRAGHLLFQPTQPVAGLLAERGIKVDSSVYKGGRWNQRGQDYRQALKNGYYWKFSEDVNRCDAKGALLELPIYTQMVPSWRMINKKRGGFQAGGSSGLQVGKKILNRLGDFARFRYPLKLDFCSMARDELTRTIDRVFKEDQQDPYSLRPLIAIGHTKEIVDFEVVDSLLSYLDQKRIPVATFERVYEKVMAVSI